MSVGLVAGPCSAAIFPAPIHLYAMFLLKIICLPNDKMLARRSHEQPQKKRTLWLLPTDIQLMICR